MCYDEQTGSWVKDHRKLLAMKMMINLDLIPQKACLDSINNVAKHYDKHSKSARKFRKS